MRRLVIASLGCLALLVFGAGPAWAGRSAATRPLPASPAYTADQLNASPGDNWLTNGGDLKNDRFSTLTQISPSNVGTLKEAWHVNLGTCPTKNQQCGSYEANAVVADGVYYIVTPKSDVFALDAVTGKTIWHYAPNYLPIGCVPTGSCDPSLGFNVGTGGRQPGVAIGEGKVFLGQRDGFLVALDQVTGGVLWSTEEIPWKKGGRLSSAPLYYNGMVIEGTSGGDGGSVSNTMEAFDATNGRQLWSWSIVPAPGQPGSNTWAASDTHYGGGAMWETPAIDPGRNLAIFGTGNPVPWNSRGPGANLYSDSIVALNVYTGQLVWAYQTVHHDLWDADLPNSPVLFDAKFKVPVMSTVNVKVKVKGKTVTRKKTVTKMVAKQRPALAEVAKYGWTWILDRETGKPLTQVKNVPVPQSTAPEVNTWPTQPIPVGPNVVDDPKAADGLRTCADGEQTQTNAYVAFAKATAPDGKPFKLGCAFDPYDTTQYVVMPFEEMDWPVSSYSPQAKVFITCGVSRRARAFAQIPSASQVRGAAGGFGVAALGVGDTSTSNFGNFSALNVEGNTLTWHQKWDAPCYSGTANTASGLTFVDHIGEGNGRDGLGYLEAVDTKTGASLWKSPLMDAPATAAPVTYAVNGKQYVSILVGGQGHNDPTRPHGLTSPDRLRGDSVYTYALP